MDSGVFADQYSWIIKACLRSGSSIPLDRSGIWDDFSGGVYTRAGEKKKIHLLDRYVMETICRELGERRRQGQFIVPISMNFSRLDFDVPKLSSRDGKNYGKEFLAEKLSSY